MSSSTVQRSTFGIERNTKNERVITGNFASLLNLPPPDTSLHPAFQPDPHSSTSNAPLMVTTSTEQEIREWAKQRRNFEVEQGIRPRTNTIPRPIAGNAFAQAAYSPVAPTPFSTPERPPRPPGLGVRTIQTASSNQENSASNVNIPRTPGRGRKSSENLGIRTKMSRLNIDQANNTDADIFDILAEGSPPSQNVPQPPKTPVDSVKSIPMISDFEHRKTGLRKMSAMFKSKPTIDKNASDLSQVELPNADGSNWYRPDLVSLPSSLCFPDKSLTVYFLGILSPPHPKCLVTRLPPRRSKAAPSKHKQRLVLAQPEMHHLHGTLLPSL